MANETEQTATPPGQEIYRAAGEMNEACTEYGCSEVALRQAEAKMSDQERASISAKTRFEKAQRARNEARSALQTAIYRHAEQYHKQRIAENDDENDDAL